uniref:Cyclin-dependent kinase 2-interacting protein n=1 Tax=Cuerna arida TaxID=1464854 RepID=A0A1B6GKZ2_9HEMI
MSVVESSNLSSPISVQFEDKLSPVLVRESPVNKTPQRGNLTGNPRKIRDSAADLYNLIQEWNNYHIKGSEILTKIHLLKNNSIKEDGNSQPKPTYPDGLQELCDDLNNHCTLMSKVVERMLTTKTEVGGVVKLETLRNSSDSPMFLTWPADRFDETWSLITNAYETELALKIYIKENVAHTTTEANLMFLLAAWAHQPYVETGVDVALEALLKETGHR